MFWLFTVSSSVICCRKLKLSIEIFYTIAIDTVFYLGDRAINSELISKTHKIKERKRCPVGSFCTFVILARQVSCQFLFEIYYKDTPKQFVLLQINQYIKRNCLQISNQFKIQTIFSLILLLRFYCTDMPGPLLSI